MSFVAGIDGGGTKTLVRCCDARGELLSEEHFGPFNLNGIGEKRFRSLLGEITAYLSAQGRCEGLCIGSAGASNPSLQRLLDEELTHADIARWRLVGDCVIAHVGALAGRDGLILIAGTGSICYGRAHDDREVRIGGWGHLIGDEGSGYALGRDALIALTKAQDGCGDETLLTRLLQEERGLKTREQIIEYAYCGDKAPVAALAPLVDRAARAGDRVAEEIVRRNALALVKLAVAARQGLNLGRTEIALLGGLLQHPTCLREALLLALREAKADFSCIQPEGDACAGAVRLALMVSGRDYEAFH